MIASLYHWNRSKRFINLLHKWPLFISLPLPFRVVSNNGQSRLFQISIGVCHHQVHAHHRSTPWQGGVDSYITCNFWAANDQISAIACCILRSIVCFQCTSLEYACVVQYEGFVQYHYVNYMGLFCKLKNNNLLPSPP